MVMVMLSGISVRDTAHVGKPFSSEAWHPGIPPLLQGKEQGVWAGPGGGCPLDSPSAPCCCWQEKHSRHPRMSLSAWGSVWDGWREGRAQQYKSLPRTGWQCAPTFLPAPRGVLILLLGRVASGLGVGAEVLAPGIAPLQPPKSLTHPTQPSGGKDDGAPSHVS